MWSGKGFFGICIRIGHGGHDHWADGVSSQQCYPNRGDGRNDSRQTGNLHRADRVLLWTSGNKGSVAEISITERFRFLLASFDSRRKTIRAWVVCGEMDTNAPVEESAAELLKRVIRQ